VQERQRAAAEASGVIFAPINEAWQALIDSLPLLASTDKQNIKNMTSPTAFTITYGRENESKLHVEVDQERHYVALQGEWWYRGVYILSPHERGCMLQHQVYNVAGSFSRWMVPLMNSKLDVQTKDEARRVLNEIGKHLKCETFITDWQT
jgi:hypothetical protein